MLKSDVGVCAVVAKSFPCCVVPISTFCQDSLRSRAQRRALSTHTAVVTSEVTLWSAEENIAVDGDLGAIPGPWPYGPSNFRLLRQVAAGRAQNWCGRRLKDPNSAHSHSRTGPG
jgi:hypothetical protein